MPISVVCAHCNKTFQAKLSDVARGTRFCSKKCFDDIRRLPPEIKQAHRRESSRQWKLRNPEKIEAYKQATVEQTRAHKRAWLERNRERHNQQTARWNATHPETTRAIAQRYRKRHPHKTVALAHKRRARLLAAPGRYTAAEFRALCALYDHTCLCCGRREPDIKLGPDHVIPLSKGGSNAIENIQPMCRHCNCRKRDKIIDYRDQRS